ncbi:MAG: hypothetical protein GY711_27880 [bacterium]|nr:hypothetical protein [bacterium]
MNIWSRRRWIVLALALSCWWVGWRAPGVYRTHVEQEFEDFMTSIVPGGAFHVLETRCVGKPSAGIALRPIAVSRFTGSYPYIDEIPGPRDRAYMETMYWHGYWLNYCKRVKTSERDLIAYWSLRQDRWFEME